MNDKVKLYLSQGKYCEANELLKNLEFSDIKNIIMSIAYDTESIFIYDFILFMLKKSNEKNWIELCIDVMLNPLCFLEGAYSVALFHSRELLKNERNVLNLERILFFYNIPEKLVDKNEAKSIAQEILKLEPDNFVAHDIVKEINE